jgi:hypothetical protein
MSPERSSTDPPSKLKTTGATGVRCPSKLMLRACPIVSAEDAECC